jgi:hypothetical protein
MIIHSLKANKNKDLHKLATNAVAKLVKVGSHKT